MTVENLHDAIGLIPTDLLEEADKKRSRRPKVIRWKELAAMAASLALVIFLFQSGVLPGFDAKSDATAEAAPAAAAPQAIEAAGEDAAEAPAAQSTGGTNFSGNSKKSAAAEEEAAAYDAAPAETLAVFDAPPVLEVGCEDNAISIQTGSYTWSQALDDGTTQEVIACGANPLDDIDRLPVLETAETAVTLKWELPPVHITAQCWPDAESEAESVTLAGCTLHLKPGTYVYEVSAEWESGSGSYAFVAVVPES